MTPDVVASILFGLKILTIAGLVLYTIFSLILVRQEQLMADVLEEGFEPILRLLVMAHLIASVGLLIFAFVLL